MDAKTPATEQQLEDVFRAVQDGPAQEGVTGSKILRFGFAAFVNETHKHLSLIHI